jgi:hypothetical protein
VKLKALLHQKKDDILKRWISLTFETYPPDVFNFLRLEKDRFVNPVGHTISISSETILDELIHGENSNKTASALDSIIRIRTVQDFTPSQAIEFIFLLKKAVREELKVWGQGFKAEDEQEILEELVLFEKKIDDLAALTVEIYAKCRDDIHRIKVGGTKN